MLKNTTSLISRILFLNYHLSSPNITDGVLLPTLELERVVLKRSFTWHYSSQGLPYKTIACLIRKLLPHVFTFSPYEVVIFCGTFSAPKIGTPAINRWVTLCCPDFPWQLLATIVRVCSRTKVVN